ncbi:hypothetical protein KCV87_09995 [Actinosynnema pretiosum subsp. pretiosum]|uniref:Uncharacterized protein n=1 Tax=Actinosynnema pretiosum subsp. pretiosum TaxID=103721 RepID=A0AA45LAF9_9PSEU|nr:hypothetical protein APASM_2037 [Actinosynnema pretiosum subsp. pretiosum]QUF06352.1 hypothetical protein KCV87_09995 [Actinosynnema pretiosum subsp. pretiosum]
MNIGTRFAVLLYQATPDSHVWLGDVISSEGARNAPGAGLRDDVAAEADDLLWEMLKGLPPQRVEVWYVRTTKEIADSLKHLSPTALFLRVRGLEGDGTTVDPQILRTH